MTAGGRLAPLLEKPGAPWALVTTSDPTAQRFFNQGMTLLSGLNHAEAIHSFREVARIDPGCSFEELGACHTGEQSTGMGRQTQASRNCCNAGYE